MYCGRALCRRCVYLSVFISLAGGCGPVSLTPPSEQQTAQERSFLFEQAQRLFEAGQLQNAIDVWEKVPPSDVKYLDAQFAIREARLQINQIRQNQVVSLDTTSQFDRYVEQAEQSEIAGDFQEALELYEEARLLEPGNQRLHEKIEELHALLEDAVERHKALGKLYFSQGEYVKATQEWERLLLIEPQNEQARQRLADIEVLTATSDSVFFQRGRSLMKKGLVNQAKAEFEKALRVNASNERTRSLLTRLEQIPFTKYTVQKGDTLSLIAEQYTQNASDFTILADFNGLDSGQSLNIGQIIKIPHIYRFQAALDPDGDDAMSEAPDEAGTRGLSPSIEPNESLASLDELSIQGMAAYRQGDYRKAMMLFEQIYERDPENQEAYEYFLRAAAGIRGGMPFADSSFNASTTPVNSHKAEIEKLLEDGRIAREAGKLNDALALFEKALQIQPGNREIRTVFEETQTELKEQITLHLNEGIKFFNREALEDAILEWEKVLVLDPTNPQALEYRDRAGKMLDALSSSN